MRVVGQIVSVFAIAPMRVVGQIVSVFAIALGVGLLVAGSAVSPVVDSDIGDRLMRELRWTARDLEDRMYLAAALKGFGSGLLTLGVAGLLVPWANSLIFGLRSVSSPSTSKLPNQSLNPTGAASSASEEVKTSEGGPGG